MHSLRKKNRKIIYFGVTLIIFSFSFFGINQKTSAQTSIPGWTSYEGTFYKDTANNNAVYRVISVTRRPEGIVGALKTGGTSLIPQVGTYSALSSLALGSTSTWVEKIGFDSNGFTGVNTLLSASESEAMLDLFDDRNRFTVLSQDPTQPYNIGTDGSTFAYNPTSGRYETKNQSGAVTNTYDPTDPFVTNVSNRPDVQAAAAAGLKTKVNSTGDEGLCFWDVNVKNAWTANWTLNNCIEQILYSILWILSLAVGVAGWVLSITIDYTLIHMKEHIEGVGAINAGWQAVRDLVNICFIFILLYIAIGTIIGVDEHGTKHALVKLVIIAMLINFSMFFTKVIIDASNILAFEFYNKIVPSNVTNLPATGVLGGIGANEKVNKDFGDAVMGAFKLQTIYNPDNPNNQPLRVAANSATFSSNAVTFAQGNNTIIVFIMGIIFIIVTICVLLASCFIFLYRYVALIFLMIFAPAGFAGMILHSTEHMASEWWQKLIKEALAAPVFMIMMWLVFSIIQSDAFFTSNQQAGSLEASLNQASQSGRFITDTINNMGANVILNFSIVSFMMFFALVMVEHIGAKGAEKAVHSAEHMIGFAGGWVGGQTLGRLSSSLINKTDRGDDLRNVAAGAGKHWYSNNIVSKYAARAVVGSADGIGAAGFGGHHTSFADQTHKEEEWTKEAVENMHNDPELIAQLFKNNGKGGMFSMSRKGMDDYFHHLSADQKANVELHLRDQILTDLKATHSSKNLPPPLPPEEEKAFAENAALLRYYTSHGHGRMTEEEANKVQRAKLGSLDYYDAKLRKKLSEIKTGTGYIPGHADEVRKLLLTYNSPDQITSALKTMGENMKKFEGNETHAVELRSAITEATRNKFDSEAAFSSAAKDPVFGKDLKASIAEGGWRAATTFGIYKTLEEDIATSPNGQAAQATVNAFVRKMESLENMKTALVAFTAAGGANSPQAVIDLLNQYKENERVRDETTYKYFMSTNGQRSQTVSTSAKSDLQQAFTITGDTNFNK